MSADDAGKVGIKLADAAMVLARCTGLAALIFAIGQSLVPIIAAIRWW